MRGTDECIRMYNRPFSQEDFLFYKLPECLQEIYSETIILYMIPLKDKLTIMW